MEQQQQQQQQQPPPDANWADIPTQDEHVPPQQQQQQPEQQQQEYEEQDYANHPYPHEAQAEMPQPVAAAMDYSALYGTNHAAPAPETDTNPQESYHPPECQPYTNANEPARKRRLCKFPGCTKVVKSQGHCQAHGAKAKRCSVEGCDKQAQTTHEGMCKRHWKLKNFPESPEPTPPAAAAAAAAAEQLKSVYENVLPQSIAFRPMAAAKVQEKKGEEGAGDPLDPAPAPEGAIVMPLVAFLQEGASKPFGWHRNEEREARGLRPIANLSTQLEPWERQLAVVEILLLGGGTPYASFQNLAHGWGRKKGFHSALISGVCERRGDIIRKRKTEFGVQVGNGDNKRPATVNNNINNSPGQAMQQQQQQQQQQQHPQQPGTGPSAQSGDMAMHPNSR